MFRHRRSLPLHLDYEQLRLVDDAPEAPEDVEFRPLHVDLDSFRYRLPPTAEGPHGDGVDRESALHGVFIPDQSVHRASRAVDESGLSVLRRRRRLDGNYPRSIIESDILPEV
jgi:hypothetical protein